LTVAVDTRSSAAISLRGISPVASSRALADLRLIPAHDGNPAVIPKPAGIQARLLDLLGIDISRPRWLTQ